ncbi:putative protein kinase RLK-Pelle-RLCK-IXb family [Lupinus albus]|uniref:RING-type E3 ubiquitin transferase n=1 Tax=Lupinus albus TaxID=3870 RepID=A0A6A4NBF2_LUPAL|nr:putative protein kinase RLK-Pelle-RLCK-IXb family [Lupinus albus]
MDSIKEGSTVIAIDKDKNSQYAVKWAVDNLLKKNTTCTLIHVRTKALHPRDVETASKQGRPPTNEELHQFFLPFRGFCARKGIVAKELVLHDIDVPSALTDYIIDNNIKSIVVGAPNWNVFRRIFNDADVSSSLVKSAPESCTVHVVSKRKVENLQPLGPSQHKIIKPTTKLLKETLSLKGNSTSEDLFRKTYKNGILRQSSDVICFGQSNVGIQQVKPYISSEESKSPTLSDESNSSKLIDGSKLNENQDAVRNSNSSSTTNSSTKSPNIEKARLGEEAALALAEVEKQKTKAAMESAEMSRCLAAIEIKKRKQTEKRAMQKEEEKQRASNTNPPHNILCKRYSIEEIEVATNCFDKALKLGEGGYGPVFKGVLDNTVVAIKALRSNINQGDRQFQQEVEVLTTVRHPNMVLLLGVCPENGCLVYEFTENDKA